MDRTNSEGGEAVPLLNGTKQRGEEPSMSHSSGAYGAASATVATDSTATDSSGGSSVGEEEAPEGASLAEEQASRGRRKDAWMPPFLANIFLACASFSIVVPTLAPYVLDVGAPLSFLPWVVSSYSLGEMAGSVALGAFYERSVRGSDAGSGRGPRLSLGLSISLGAAGSAAYAAAGWVGGGTAARACLVGARFVQGLWTGGQQAIEQAYLSAAVEPSKRTEYTATLSTCAVLGFVMGPTIGVFLSRIDTSVMGLEVNANNSPGLFMTAATVFMLLQTYFFFDGTDDRTGRAAADGGDGAEDGDGEDAADKVRPDGRRAPPMNVMGVAVSMVIFYVHYYSFAVQETVITPMAMVIYDWEQVEINLLFVGAGFISLATSLAVRELTRHVDDTTMLLSSLVVGLAGSLFLLDSPFSERLPAWRFLLGFCLSQVAFPVGRNVCLGVFGNVLGPVNQGRWMGLMFAVSAIPRAIGPFVAVKLLTVVDWSTWLEFFVCSALFGSALIATRYFIRDLVPYEDYLEDIAREGSGSFHGPMPPSPLLVRSPMQRRTETSP